MWLNYRKLQIGITCFLNSQKQIACFWALIQGRKSGDKLLQIGSLSTENKYESLEDFYRSEEFCEILNFLRSDLSYRHELRALLSLDRILQHDIQKPDSRLIGQNREKYLALQAGKVFPLDTKLLAVDYTESNKSKDTLLFTAAKLDDIRLLQDIYFESGFHLGCVEIAASALQRLATIYFASPKRAEPQVLALPNHEPESYLLLGCDGGSVFWSTVGNIPFEYGFINPLLPFIEQIPPHLATLHCVYFIFSELAVDLRYEREVLINEFYEQQSKQQQAIYQAENKNIEPESQSRLLENTAVENYVPENHVRENHVRESHIDENLIHENQAHENQILDNLDSENTLYDKESYLNNVERYTYDDNVSSIEEIEAVIFSLSDYSSIPSWQSINEQTIHTFTLLDLRFFNPMLQAASQAQDSFTQHAILALALASGALKHG